MKKRVVNIYAYFWHLYESLGFTYIGDEDVRPEVEHIPAFSLYELNFDEE